MVELKKEGSNRNAGGTWVQVPALGNADPSSSCWAGAVLGMRVPLPLWPTDNGGFSSFPYQQPVLVIFQLFPSPASYQFLSGRYPMDGRLVDGPALP